MKYRVISLILVLFFAVGLTIPRARAAQEREWSYEQIDGGVRLLAYLGSEKELVLPDSLAGMNVVEIGSGCFRSSDLEEVTIPHGIRVIGAEAFYGCDDLKKVYIGGSVNVIGDRAFAYSGLIKMDIPGCVRSIGEEAFLGCDDLYNIVIEEGVEEWASDIGESFGSGSVTMEEGVESIGRRAFYGCKNLTRMRIPGSVTSIGQQAIGYTDSGKQSSYQITGVASSAAEDYANENSLKFVPVEAGNGTSGICGEEVSWGFERASGTLTLVGSGRMYDYAAVECLPWHAFRDEIVSVVLGEAITSVGDYAFSGTAIEEVELSGAVAWMGAKSFANCEKLRKVIFTGNAPVFADDAFENSALTGIYPNHNFTWTVEVRQSYGGTVTWRCAEGLPFVDVPEGSFYYDSVAWALDHGITTGTDATHFSPNNKCQRAAVVTFLWRAAGSPKPESDHNPFVDVKPKDYYYEAVLWAVETGVTNGLNATQFGPFSYCNRAQVVTFLHRAMGEPAVTDSTNPFTDVPAGQWYTNAVLWAVENEVTNGLSATSFGPMKICNRAQIVTFLFRTMGK